jgi:hypothetical protein
MVRRHREQVDWRKADVDLMALYGSEGERDMDSESMVLF